MREASLGADRERGIRLNGLTPEVVDLGDGITESDLMVHDETNPDPALAFIMSRLHWPEFPEPLGVFRAVERPTFETLMAEQIEHETERMGEGDLRALMMEGDTWTVE
jgi:2-oxoglutarate ferredoxin oxidoreductase subunit beta